MKKQYQFRIFNFAGIILMLLMFSFFSLTDVQAQKVSLTANFKAFGVDKVEGINGTEVAAQGRTSISGNLRLFSKNLWALRLGAGIDNLNYTVGDGVQTNFDVLREDIEARVGVEKHFNLAFLNPYLGLYVPFHINSKDNVTNNVNGVQDQFENESFTTGLNVVAGANLKLLKVLRLGAEFNAGFNQFKDEIVDNIIKGESVTIKNLDIGTEITLGIAF